MALRQYVIIQKTAIFCNSLTVVSNTYPKKLKGINVLLEATTIN